MTTWHRLRRLLPSSVFSEEVIDKLIGHVIVCLLVAHWVLLAPKGITQLCLKLPTFGEKLHRFSNGWR